MRSGGRGGRRAGAGAGGCGGPGGALTRRAVTLRVLLKDALLEPGAGVLSIYYLVSAPTPIPSRLRQEGETEAQSSLAAGRARVCGGKAETEHPDPAGAPLGRRTSFTKHPIAQRRNLAQKRTPPLSRLWDLAQPLHILVPSCIKWLFFFPPHGVV